MRLFVALTLPEDVRQRLSGLAFGMPTARRVAPENLHLTLRFIGEVDNGQAEDIDLALSAISSPAFDLTLGGAGYFASARRLRSVWAGVERCEPLVHLHEKVESAVVRAGFAPEGRKFKPHITLARFRNTQPTTAGPFIAANNTFTTDPFMVEKFTLFQSRLSHSGATYQVMGEYPLEGQE